MDVTGTPFFQGAMTAMVLVALCACDGCERTETGPAPVAIIPIRQRAALDLTGCTIGRIAAVDERRAAVVCVVPDAPTQLVMHQDGQPLWGVDLPCIRAFDIAVTAKADLVTVRCHESRQDVHSLAFETGDGRLRWATAPRKLREPAFGGGRGDVLRSARVGDTLVELDVGGGARGLAAATGEIRWEVEDSLATTYAKIHRFPDTNLVSWPQNMRKTEVRDAQSGVVKLAEPESTLCFLPDGFVIEGKSRGSVRRVSVDGGEGRTLQLPPAATSYGYLMECGLRGDALVVVINPKKGPIRLFKLPTNKDDIGLTVAGAVDMTFFRSAAEPLPRYVPIVTRLGRADIDFVDLDTLRSERSITVLNNLSKPESGTTRVLARWRDRFLMEANGDIALAGGDTPFFGLLPGTFVTTPWRAHIRLALHDNLLWAARGTREEFVMESLVAIPWRGVVPVDGEQGPTHSR